MTTVTSKVNVNLSKARLSDLKGELNSRGYACVEFVRFDAINDDETELSNIKRSVHEIFEAYKIGDESRARELSIALAEDVTGGTIT